MNYPYIIIDDDQESVLKTKAIASSFSELDFVASANNYSEGLNLILEHNPKLIFLEIDPTDKASNLSLALINELYRYLKVIPKIIITTSKKDLAFECIQYEVAEYLIKPIKRIDIIKSLLKIKKSISEDEAYINQHPVAKEPQPTISYHTQSTVEHPEVKAENLIVDERAEETLVAQQQSADDSTDIAVAEVQVNYNSIPESIIEQVQSTVDYQELNDEAQVQEETVKETLVEQPQQSIEDNIDSGASEVHLLDANSLEPVIEQVQSDFDYQAIKQQENQALDEGVQETLEEQPQSEYGINNAIATETQVLDEASLLETQIPEIVVQQVVPVVEQPLILCIKSYGDYRYIDANDICYFQADNNSTDINLNNGEMVTAFKTLKHFEGVLPFPFARIHNSYIVNRNYISRIHTGNAVCYIKNTTTKLPFSKSYKENVDLIISEFANGNYLEI